MDELESVNGAKAAISIYNCGVIYIHEGRKHGNSACCTGRICEKS
jgi:hypothetical protein